MNAKMCKKLRWYARVQEAMMPTPTVNEKGVSSLLLVYEHPKTWKDFQGDEHTFVNRTVQYNPRTSGKGFYKALKGRRARIAGKLAFCRYMCQRRIIELLTVRSGGTPSPAESLQQGPQPGLGALGDREALAGNVVPGRDVTDEL